MYHIRAIFLFGLLILSSAFCRAESDPVVHNFGEMGGAKTIQYANANKVGKTDLTTYTCTGTGATFDRTLANGHYYVDLKLAKTNDMVTTTAITDLSGIELLQHTPYAQLIDNLEIRLSYDSIRWTEPIEASGSSGHMWSNFLPGKYYVRIKNTTGTAMNIWQITWRFGDPCNCFMYIPE